VSVVEEGRQARLETSAAMAPRVTVHGAGRPGRCMGGRGRPRAYQPDARRQGCFAPLRGGLRPSL